jgi:hypothetical protein
MRRATAEGTEHVHGTCSGADCDRLASGAPDSNGDLCGVCRDAEVALGREPVPRSAAEMAEDDAYEAARERLAAEAQDRRGAEDDVY